ncbi:FAD-binding domain protein [Aspergillus sclerotialis]|uniref:ferric-chelate reductase (NADPH) n=1 Tax=Aspergillus sclerotialis TaxID=2070753 RepID=A0A3A3A534_9EURO|nr:FAD-binding domain protein [Aspergillus sclerotialis]
MAADVFGISLPTYRHFHRTFGMMSVIQSILHVAFALQNWAFDLSNRLHQYGLMSATAILALLILALPWVRQLSYEFFLKGHTILGIFVVGVTWLHLRRRRGIDGLWLIGGLGAFLLNLVVHVLFQIFRNSAAGHSLALADVVKHEDAVELTFRPPRPWKVYAGQYVYVRAPGVRSLSFAESHPFKIVWWERGPDGKAVSISLLAQVRSGFTRALYGSPYNRLRILLDGPYGEQNDLKGYSSVVLVATGIGIAAQLSYVKDFVESTLQMEDQELSTSKKRITLIWQMEEEYHEDWICDWMDKLLNDDDKFTVLRYSLYILRSEKTISHDSQKVHVGRRGKVFYGKPNIKSVLEEEKSSCSGRLLLSVSADPETRDEVRSLVLAADDTVDLKESDYQPPHGKRGFWAPKAEARNLRTA